MSHASAILLNIFRQAWTTLVVLIVVIVLLAMLSQVLRLVGSTTMGARIWVQQSIASILGLFLLVAFAFLAVPSIVQAASVSIGGINSCGPIAELGGFASQLIAGLVALRMLRGVFVGIVSAAAGGSTGTSEALTETGEAVFAMVLVSVAVPIAAAFLGAC